MASMTQFSWTTTVSVCEALNNCNASWSHDDELRHEEEVAEQQ